MFRLSLLRLNFNLSLIEISIGEVSTNVNVARPLLGISWHWAHGFDFGFLWLRQWGLALSPGVRIVDARAHWGWHAELFGHFDFSIVR